jgi:hypothetical protein
VCRPRRKTSVENKTAQDILYTAACCLWATAIAFLLGWALKLLHLQTGFTYFCLNAFIDWLTIFFIVKRPVPHLTLPMSFLLFGAILLNTIGWLSYRNNSNLEWYASGLGWIAALQIAVFLNADTRYRLGLTPARITDWVRTWIGKAHKRH